MLIRVRVPDTSDYPDRVRGRQVTARIDAVTFEPSTHAFSWSLFPAFAPLEILQNSPPPAAPSPEKPSEGPKPSMKEIFGDRIRRLEVEFYEKKDQG